MKLPVLRPGNLLLVHGTGESRVSVRATTDDLQMEQQESFIRSFCAGGFLNGEAEPLGGFRERVPDREEPPVRWIVDPSRPRADADYASHVRRLCRCTAGTMRVWLALMVAWVGW